MNRKMDVLYLLLGFLLVIGSVAWLSKEEWQQNNSSSKKSSIIHPDDEKSNDLSLEDTYFPSGVSSYQGTSTGPGVDNGYNATPSGIYNVSRETENTNTFWEEQNNK